MRFAIKYHVGSSESGPPGHEDYTPEHDEETLVDTLEDAARFNPISVLTFPGGENVPMEIVDNIILASRLEGREPWVARYKKQYEEIGFEVKEMYIAKQRVEEYKRNTNYWN